MLAGVALADEEGVDALSIEAYPYAIAHVQQHLDGDTAPSFEMVLDLILDGLAQLDADRPRDHSLREWIPPPRPLR